MSQPVTHYLSDYQAPQFKIETVLLTFELSAEETLVTNKMVIRCLEQDFSKVQLDLNGENLQLISVKLNNERLDSTAYRVSDELLTLSPGLAQFELEIVTKINPQNNTSLEGLYRSSGNYCTQCEAQGFRTITYYLDRPDVLSLFTTKIIASKKENSVLLSNGNLIESGELADGKHYAVWQDPHPKPCYLFALVAGNLEWVQDEFTTQEGRRVDLRIYVEPDNIHKCDHAMASLKKAMAWDEQRFGLSYDLDVYMIVAVDDFNMGAMENKGLNIFNSKFVLGRPETATDTDYEGIEAVIGHEYFHNWTGNRVTCRDWFQLTLKEGLTVFRDQEFTADMLSPAVKRIDDVKQLRSNQFPEDAGPMSHPIQPQSYIEMNNFYTMTVYEKGAEVVRLYQTLLGREGFRKGLDCYIERHDGQAVTIQDFRQAMEDANQVDLAQMQNWYDQAGTPRLKVESIYDASTAQLTISLTQSLPAEEFRPFLLPVKIGFLSHQGQVLLPKIHSESNSEVVQAGEDYLLKLTAYSQSYVFEGLTECPVISWLRDFSAPVILQAHQSVQDLEILASFDGNSFVRWEAMQTLAMQSLKTMIQQHQSQQAMSVLPAYSNAFKAVLLDDKIDQALKTQALSLPEMGYVGEQFDEIPVESLFAAYQALQQQLAQAHEADLLATYQALVSSAEYVYTKEAIAQRRLKNACLRYLMKLPKYLTLAVTQYQTATNMTDELAALETLTHTQTPEKNACLTDFYQKWSKDSLVMDKWFALQSASQTPDALDQVSALIQHPDFSMTNPNRVRSVVGVFGRLNLLGFHQQAGYQFLADQVIQLDAINPQVASRMVGPFTHWRKYDAQRQAMMKAQLQRILAVKGLSKDVFEIVSKSLGH